MTADGQATYLTLSYIAWLLEYYYATIRREQPEYVWIEHADHEEKGA